MSALFLHIESTDSMISCNHACTALHIRTASAKHFHSSYAQRHDWRKNFPLGIKAKFVILFFTPRYVCRTVFTMFAGSAVFRVSAVFRMSAVLTVLTVFIASACNINGHIRLGTKSRLLTSCRSLEEASGAAQ